MKPILLIHGYSSEGKDTKVEDIYGSLPGDLRKEFGEGNVKDINLSRWISLSDGIALDDVSFAMNRALNEQYPDLLKSGFHVIIHSTGALVVRNWIRLFSPKPSPINNLVHLAGANFGSGLAHIGQGQLARWGRLIFQGTGRGTRVLDELEFGSWKTLDLHIGYLQKGNDMYADYQVQEFCMIGSQTLGLLRPIPIRYVKEDSADNTVRTSACNLNFNYIPVKPKQGAFNVDVDKLSELIKQRLNNQQVEPYYEYDISGLCTKRPEVPFAVVFETAHFDKDIGIVSGTENRTDVMRLLNSALKTPYDRQAYQNVARFFEAENAGTFARAAQLRWSIFEWNKQEQYEGHAQLIFRLKDQFGNAVEHFDITFKSQGNNGEESRLEDMIEDKHNNSKDNGTITFYLRTQKFNETWNELLAHVAPVDVEITGYEPLSDDIAYLPVNIRLSNKEINAILQSFRTTIVDVVLARLPSDHVFEIKKV
jgi:hypothetical protein